MERFTFWPQTFLQGCWGLLSFDTKENDKCYVVVRYLGNKGMNFKAMKIIAIIVTDCQI